MKMCKASITLTSSSLKHVALSFYTGGTSTPGGVGSTNAPTRHGQSCDGETGTLFAGLGTVMKQAEIPRTAGIVRA
jgi:hypothetical protein